MTKNFPGIPFLCKINEPQTIHIMKVRFLYLLCLLTCILPACSSDDNEPVDEPVTITVTGVSVSPESISLECGETKQLTAQISPENATAGDITWTSSDEAIATVSSDGTVTGISKGTATVTATVSGKSGTCEVTVTQEVQSVEISPATATLTSKGETIQLTATVLPEGAGEATWTSSDEAVATVSPEGIVTAIGEGTATITATAGEKTATCTITVSISIVDIEGNQATFHLDGASTAQVSQAISEAAQAGVTRFILTGDSEALGLYDENPFSGIQIELLDLSGVTGWQDRDADGLPELPAESFRHTGSFDFSGLQEVILPQEIQQLQDYAFYKCSNLTKITAPGVVRVNSFAFQSCTKLAEVSMPEVTYLGTNAFMSTALQVADFSKLQTLEGGVFWLCSKLTEVNLPEATTIGNATLVPQVGSRTGVNTFGDCSQLEKVYLPKATTIGDDAFSNCKSLKEIELPQATTVGIKAFYNCTALTSVNLPQATALGDDVFTECTALNTIKLTAEGSISVQNTTFGPADTITKNVDLTLNINKKGETWDEFWQEEEWKGHKWKSISFVE